MTLIAESMAEMYRAQGFEVSRVKNESSLLSLANNPLVACADGRCIGGTVFPHLELGPKVLGATPGQANLLAAKEGGMWKKTNHQHLEKAISLNNRLGYISGFHDIHDDEVHCGQQHKMQHQEIKSLPHQVYTPQEAKAIILSRGGKGLDLLGPHVERRVIANMVEGTTRPPDGTTFMLDLWHMLSELKIPAHIVVASSAEIIKMLSPVRELLLVG